MPKSASPVQRIRDSNQKRILALLLEKKQLSKQQIARETSLSIPTVTMNVGRLIDLGIAEEAGVSASRGGRKPMIIRFLEDSRYAFGVDFASNHLTASDRIRVILVNLATSIRAEESFEYREFSSVEQIMARVRRTCDRILDGRKIPRQRVMGIGFSLPGTVNERRLLLEQAPNLPADLGMNSLDFTRFRRQFPFPIFIENEANAAAYAELRSGAAKGKRSMVFLSINRGIGAGIVVGGRVFKGANKRAGTVGHVTMEPAGPRCTCGRRGCWEIYAASGALIRNYRRSTGRKLKDTHQFQGLLTGGDAAAEQVWAEYVEALALGINNIILSLDPHSIIIGGEVSGFGTRLLEPLRSRVVAQNTFCRDDDLEIELSQLKGDASILGAATLPFHGLLHQGAKVI